MKSSNKLVFGSDHAGFELKKKLLSYMNNLGYDTDDIGTDSEDPVDYPDYAFILGKEVVRNNGIGILICGSGIGMSIAVNRFSGVRGALLYTTQCAKMARLHNDANVLILGSRITSYETAKDICDAFFSTKFEGGRHVNRVKKLYTKGE